MRRKWSVSKVKGRWWVIRPTGHPTPWIAEWVGVSWTEAMSQVRKAIVSSQDACKAKFEAEVDEFVETHYSHVMPESQRDLVKRIAKGWTYQVPRPWMHKVLRNTAREVVAVISAGHDAE